MDRQPQVDPAVRRRVLGAVAASMAFTGLAALVAFWGEEVGIPAAWSVPAAILLILAGTVVMVVGFEPARRAALEHVVGAAPARISRPMVLEVLGFSVLVALVARFVTGLPWADALGRIPGIVIYLTVFQVLARIQRRGVPPYIRPAGYGFALAGVSGGLVWAAIAGEQLARGVIAGLVWSLMHYLYVRYSTRGAADMLARRAAPRDAPTQ